MSAPAGQGLTLFWSLLYTHCLAHSRCSTGLCWLYEWVPFLPWAMIIATIYLVLVIYLILLVGSVLSQEKSPKIWTVMMATGLERRVNVRILLSHLQCFSGAPSIYMWLRKFNTFSYWLIARVKDQLFSASVVLMDRGLLLQVRFSFLYVTNSSCNILHCTSTDRDLLPSVCQKS